MKIRTLVIIVVLSLFAAFIWVNWAEISKPTTINFIFQKYEAPLGIALLAWTAIVLIIFFIYLFYLKSDIFLRERRNAKKLNKAQKLADDEEQSRFLELKSFIDLELKNIKEVTFKLDEKLNDLIKNRNSSTNIV